MGTKTGKSILSKSRYSKFKKFLWYCPNHGLGPSLPLKDTIDICTGVSPNHSWYYDGVICLKVHVYWLTVTTILTF